MPRLVELERNTIMAGGTAVLLSLFGLFALIGCSNIVSDKPSEGQPSMPSPPISKETPEVQVKDGGMSVPGATIIVDGAVFDGEAPLNESTSLVGIVKGDDVFLWHPGLSTTELTEHTSRDAVAHLIFGSELSQAASLITTGYESTGITITKTYPITFKNEQKRLHAVVEAIDNSRGSPNILGPGKSYQSSVASYNLHKGSARFELYGSLAHGLMAAVYYGEAKRGLTNLYETALQEGADPEVFTQLAAIEQLGVIDKVVSSLIGKLSIGECLNAVAKGAGTVYLYALEALERNSLDADGLTSRLKDALLGPAINCASDTAVGLASVVLKTVGKALDIVLNLAYINDRIVANLDVFLYDAYTVIGCGHSIKALPCAPHSVDAVLENVWENYGDLLIWTLSWTSPVVHPEAPVTHYKIQQSPIYQDDNVPIRSTDTTWSVRGIVEASTTSIQVSLALYTHQRFLDISDQCQRGGAAKRSDWLWFELFVTSFRHHHIRKLKPRPVRLSNTLRWFRSRRKQVRLHSVSIDGTSYLAVAINPVSDSLKSDLLTSMISMLRAPLGK